MDNQKKVNIKKIFLCGGIIIILIFCLFRKNINELINNIEFKMNYDVKLEKLESKMIEERENYKYSQLCDGRILITGGNLFSQNLKSTEIFDPKTGKFSKGPDMNYPHRYHRQYTTNSCDVIIADTNCFETYNSNENKFETWKNSSIKNRLNSNTAKIYGVSYIFDYLNNKLLVTGGFLFDENNKKGKSLKNAFVVDVKQQNVRQIENMPFSIYHHNSILLDNYVIIWGGNSDFSSKYLKFDFKNNKFKSYDFGESLYTMKRNKCFVSQNRDIFCLNYHPNECDRCWFSIDYVPNKYRFIDKINFEKKSRDKFSVPDIIFGIESEEDSTNEYFTKDGNIIFLAKNCKDPYLLMYSIHNNKFLKMKINRLNIKNLIKLNDNLILLIDDVGHSYILRME